MKKKTCYLFIFDGFADWEVSYATIGIMKSDHYQLRTIAIDKSKKLSMGGLVITPDYDFIPQVDLDDITSDNTGLLILPGGPAWEDETNTRIYPLIQHCIENDIPVAAMNETQVVGYENIITSEHSSPLKFAQKIFEVLDIGRNQSVRELFQNLTEPIHKPLLRSALMPNA